MANLERRIAQLERTRTAENLKAMSDRKLEDYIESLELESPHRIPAILALILRHGSTIPIVEDPDWIGR